MAHGGHAHAHSHSAVTRGLQIRLGFLGLGRVPFTLPVAQLARVRWG